MVIYIVRLCNFIYLDSQTKLQLDLNVNHVLHEIDSKGKKKGIKTLNGIEMMHTCGTNFILFILLSSLKRDIC